MRIPASFREEDKAYGIVTNFSDTAEVNMIIKMTNPRPGHVKNGKYKEFNKHAVLIAEGYYVNNRKHGRWREYYDHTGSLMIEEDYRHGIPHGRFASFHPNGQLWSEGQFRDGLREGYFRVYDENGKHVKNLLFINNHQIEDVEEPEIRERT